MGDRWGTSWAMPMANNPKLNHATYSPGDLVRVPTAHTMANPSEVERHIKLWNYLTARDGEEKWKDTQLHEIVKLAGHVHD